MARMRVFPGMVGFALGFVGLTGGCQWAMPTLNPAIHQTPVQPSATPAGKAQAEPPATEPAKPDPAAEPPISGQVAAVQREVEEFVNRFPDTELARKVSASAEPAGPAPAEAASPTGSRESPSVVRVSAPERPEAAARQASAMPPPAPPVVEGPAAPSGTVSRVVPPAPLPVEPSVIRANAPVSSDRVTKPGAGAPAPAPKIEAIEIAPIPAAAAPEPVAARAEPNRAASATPAPRVRDIDATIAELQRNVDERPNDFASLFRLRMLQLADGLDDKATSPVAGLDPETGELFAELTRTLVAVRDAVRDPINRSSRAIEQTRQLAQRLRRQAAVAIDKLALVSRVNSYGDYDEIAPADVGDGRADRVRVDDVDRLAVPESLKVVDRQRVEPDGPIGPSPGVLDHVREIQTGVDGDVATGHADQVAQPAGVQRGRLTADGAEQSDQERLLAAGSVQVGERLVVEVAPLPDEGQRLGGIDLLDTRAEPRPGEGRVGGVGAQTHRDRCGHLRHLEEAGQTDLDEMVDRDVQQLPHGRDLGPAAGFPGLLLVGVVVAPPTGTAERVLISQPVGGLDLAAALRARASRQVDVVVARDRENGDRAVPGGHMGEHQHVLRAGRC